MSTDSERVLVIDDDADSRVALQLVLELYGFDTDAAADVEEAEEQLSSNSYAAVVSDLMMPGNGQTVIAHVHRVQPGTPVVVVTGNRSDRRRQVAEQDEVIVLDKPVQLDTLLQTLLDVTSKKSGT